MLEPLERSSPPARPLLVGVMFLKRPTNNSVVCLAVQLDEARAREPQLRDEVYRAAYEKVEMRYYCKSLLPPSFSVYPTSGPIENRISCWEPETNLI